VPVGLAFFNAEPCLSPQSPKQGVPVPRDALRRSSMSTPPVAVVSTSPSHSHGQHLHGRSTTPEHARWPPPQPQPQAMLSTVGLNDQMHLVSRTVAAMRAEGIVVGHPSTLKVVLPPESWAWTPLEVSLFIMSQGAYHPGEMAKRRRSRGHRSYSGGTGADSHVSSRVSIVAPSMASRQRFHESLWRCFDAQTWPDKELIVVESYEYEPSSYLLAKAKEDPRILHVCFHRESGADFPVGLKRNMTLHLASGEFVVNFDDDDLYAPSYVQTMINEMQSKQLQAITLSAWYNYYSGKGVCTFSDPESWGDWVADDMEELDGILYGYGFSYAHRRLTALTYPYPNVGFAEDAPFMLKLKEVHGPRKVALMKDERGICVHIMHRANSAEVLGSRTISGQDVGRLEVAVLKPFQQLIDNDFHRFSPWRPAVRPPAVSISVETEAEVQELTAPEVVEVSAGTRPRVDSFRNDGLWQTVTKWAVR